MGSDDSPEKHLKKLSADMGKAMEEGRAKIRELDLSEGDIPKLLNATDEEIQTFISYYGYDFDKHFLSVRVGNRVSEGYMKSPDELRNWLRRASEK